MAQMMRSAAFTKCKEIPPQPLKRKDLTQRTRELRRGHREILRAKGARYFSPASPALEFFFSQCSPFSPRRSHRFFAVDHPVRAEPVGHHAEPRGPEGFLDRHADV